MLFAFAAMMSRAGASDLVAADPTGEIFTGGNFTKNAWISWAGAVKSFAPGFSNSPFSGKASLYDEGWRLRVLGAYGQYGLITDGEANTATPQLFEITPGYQFKSGPLISKVYLGLHGEQHKLNLPDPNSTLRDMGFGVKFISENWLDLPQNSFASLDASFSTLNTSYQGMLRVGSAKYVERLTLGPEAQVVGNGEYYQLRVGAFARWKLGNGQIEASAGMARNYDKNTTPYFSASWLKRF
ncbi:MAG: cellulose biosynthesis protein BcsS [Hyphomicrobiaceae bacterium]|nr:cellulose biosynthesis protein BcsS [Hyphomicrobiaceae bacterium]